MQFTKSGDGSEPKPNPYLKAVVLTNTRQAPRFATYAPDQTPNPTLEYAYLKENGVIQELRDRNELLLNPLARSHLFYAGIDIVRAFRVLLLDRRCGAVLCVFENTALALVLLRRLFWFRPPIVLLEVSGRGWKLRDAILDLVVPRVDQVLTLTKASKRYVESTYRVKRPAIVVGYGVDEAFFRPNADFSGALSPREEYIFAVGDDHTRDYACLLEACHTLDVRVIIRSRLPIAVPICLRDRLQVIKGRLSYPALRDLYRQATLVSLPLRSADNPGGITTLFEAMAMAKPIVCSDTGATRDAVANGKNGLLVAPGDAQAMRASILWLLGHPDEAAALGKAARLWIEQNASMSQYAKRLASAIRHSASAHSQPRG